MAVLSAGDFDLVIKKTVDGLPRIHGDVNNYNDQSEFFNLPYVSQIDKREEIRSKDLFQQLPTVNFTHLQEISSSIYGSKGKEEPFKIFPRWIAQAQLYHPMTRANTSAHMIAGNQKLERKINVASQFPNQLYNRHEISTTKDVLDFLDLQIGDEVEATVSLI